MCGLLAHRKPSLGFKAIQRVTSYINDAPCKVCAMPRTNHVYDTKSIYTHDYDVPRTEGTSILMECGRKDCGMICVIEKTPYTLDDALAVLSKDHWRQIKRIWYCMDCAKKASASQSNIRTRKQAKENARNKKELRAGPTPTRSKKQRAGSGSPVGGFKSYSPRMT